MQHARIQKVLSEGGGGRTQTFFLVDDELENPNTTNEILIINPNVTDNIKNILKFSFIKNDVHCLCL